MSRPTASMRGSATSRHRSEARVSAGWPLRSHRSALRHRGCITSRCEALRPPTARRVAADDRDLVHAIRGCERRIAERLFAACGAQCDFIGDLERRAAHGLKNRDVPRWPMFLVNSQDCYRFSASNANGLGAT